MKFFNTMAVRIIAIILCFNLSFVLYGQQNTDSPYSRYGIGLMKAQDFNSSFSTGGIGQAWRPSIYKPVVYDSLARSNANLNDRQTNFINVLNPAAVSNISLTTYEVGLLSQNVNYTSGDQSRQGNNTALNHFALAFPLSEKSAVALGIRPFSFMGYDYSVAQNVQGVNATNSYEGRGGVNELFIATAKQFGKHLSLGIKGQYLFGNLQQTKRIVYSDNSFFNTIDRSELAASSVAFQTGLQYFRPINSKYRMVIGATISPIDDISAKRTNLLATYTGDDNFERIKDTLILGNDQNVNLSIPSSTSFGLSIERNGLWTAGADLSLITWSNTVEDDQVSFDDAIQFNLGFERYNQANAFGNYFKKMGYRLGFRYNSGVLQVQNTAITEMAIAAGLILPLKKTFTTINFGIELGRRGENENGLTQEEFLNLHFGLTINDKWFIKRKYD